jgi:predicted RNA-binding Zn-ribbon protein involved in translation (DUF1610 family)
LWVRKGHGRAGGDIMIVWGSARKNRARLTGMRCRICGSTVVYYPASEEEGSLYLCPLCGWTRGGERCTS